MRSDETAVASILREAAAAVAAAKIPENLQAVAFQKAVDILVGSASDESERKTETGKGSSGGDEDPIQRIAVVLKLDKGIVEETYEVQGDQIKPTIAPSKLDARKTKGTEQIALLVAGARQAAGMEEWTETKVIRDIADEYGRFDSSNFATTITSLGEYFSFSGNGPSRRLRVRRVGYEAVAELIRRLSE